MVVEQRQGKLVLVPLSARGWYGYLSTAAVSVMVEKGSWLKMSSDAI
jgi:hypothetical protein